MEFVQFLASDQHLANLIVLGSLATVEDPLTVCSSYRDPMCKPTELPKPPWALGHFFWLPALKLKVTQKVHRQSLFISLHNMLTNETHPHRGLSSCSSNPFVGRIKLTSTGNFYAARQSIIHPYPYFIIILLILLGFIYMFVMYAIKPLFPLLSCSCKH